MYKALITGGREWGFKADPNNIAHLHFDPIFKERAEFLFKTLDHLLIYRNLHIIVGDAKGVDYLVKLWCIGRNVLDHDKISYKVYEADWNKYGKSAGPIRNQLMLDQGPDIVIAFPGGNGTADMVKRAKGVGLKILEIKGNG